MTGVRWNAEQPSSLSSLFLVAEPLSNLFESFLAELDILLGRLLRLLLERVKYKDRVAEFGDIEHAMLCPRVNESQ